MVIHADDGYLTKMGRVHSECGVFDPQHSTKLRVEITCRRCIRIINFRDKTKNPHQWGKTCKEF